ncbi:MAG: AmmeMemoRadiSam system protein B [TACK group archaeon]|nr:AmmeMemoRadiSam system protein B [TACK group archaeon]
MYVRRPAAYGFYPMEGPALRKAIAAASGSDFGPGVPLSPARGKDNIRTLGFVVPHAGYAYSGPIAAHAYAQMSSQGVPDTVIVVGPNHMGYPGIFIMNEGRWETPFGAVDVDSGVANAIIDRAGGLLDTNPLAQEREHSIEVQIPFLQTVLGDRFKIVPISMGAYTLSSVQTLGDTVASAVRLSGKDVLILATTDMTHYGLAYGYTPAGLDPQEAQNFVQSVDSHLIELMANMDAEKLLTEVNQNGYTMCGSGPVAAALIALGKLGVRGGKLLKYATSYQTAGAETGPVQALVGYAALAFPK